MNLATKLQLKPDQRLVCIAAPAALAAELDGLAHDGARPEASALLAFLADRRALEKARALIVESASADRLTWVAYPKAGQLGTDLNRDSLAALLIADALRPVRQVAIDDVWSALRFRPGRASSSR